MSLSATTWQALSTQAKGDDSPDDVIARVLGEVAVLRDRIDRLTGRSARLRADLEASQAAHGETMRRLADVRRELVEAQRPSEPAVHLTPAQAVSVEYARRAWERYLAER